MYCDYDAAAADADDDDEVVVSLLPSLV